MTEHGTQEQNGKPGPIDPAGIYRSDELAADWELSDRTRQNWQNLLAMRQQSCGDVAKARQAVFILTGQVALETLARVKD